MLLRSCFFLTSFAAVFIGSSPIRAESIDSDARLAVIRQVDQQVVAKIKAEGISPAPVAGDAEFLRRIFLDLTGQVPNVSAARDFLDSDDPDKRQTLVDNLLTKPKTSDHLAEVWRNAMLPGNASPELLQRARGLQVWLRDKFSNNLRYDRIVSDIVAATGSSDDGPALFFTALDTEPKKIASATARIFLGLQLECAECHDHPFDDWKQEEFWGYAAFFARMPKSDSMMRNVRLRLTDRPSGEVTLPDTDQVVLPKFPGGRQVSADEPGTRRQQLSIWMSSPENPYLARAAVNRVWAMLFGRGIVDPVDDLGRHNPASHPEVLELLTDYFIETGYDLRELLRTLCATQTYQRTSKVDGDETPPPELIAAMTVKVLSAEQLYDSLRSCLTQSPSNEGDPSQANAAGPQNYRRLQFVTQMSGQTGKVAEFDLGLQQTLRLMNGHETVGATSVSGSPLLRGLDAPFLTDTQRINILYLATLSRYPTDDEHQRITQFIQESGVQEENRWGDVLWALINSAEFNLNH